MVYTRFPASHIHIQYVNKRLETIAYNYTKCNINTKISLRCWENIIKRDIFMKCRQEKLCKIGPVFAFCI